MLSPKIAPCTWWHKMAVCFEHTRTAMVEPMLEFLRTAVALSMTQRQCQWRNVNVNDATWPRLVSTVDNLFSVEWCGYWCVNPPAPLFSRAFAIFSYKMFWSNNPNGRQQQQSTDAANCIYSSSPTHQSPPIWLQIAIAASSNKNRIKTMSFRGGRHPAMVCGRP